MRIRRFHRYHLDSSDHAAHRARPRGPRSIQAAEIRDFLSSLFDVPLEVANPTLSARDLIDAAAARVATIDARQPLVRAQTMHTLGGLYIRLGS